MPTDFMLKSWFTFLETSFSRNIITSQSGPFFSAKNDICAPLPQWGIPSPRPSILDPQLAKPAYAPVPSKIPRSTLDWMSEEIEVPEARTEVAELTTTAVTGAE